MSNESMQLENNFIVAHVLCIKNQIIVKFTNLRQIVSRVYCSYDEIQNDDTEIDLFCLFR